MLSEWLLHYKTVNCLDGILKQSVKTSERRGQPGCSRTKTVAHAWPTKLLIQRLMKEAKQWVGVSWTKPPPPPFFLGAMPGGEALFSRLFPQESTPCGCRHQGRLWGRWSPSGNEASHTQGTIWSSLLPPVSIPHSVSQVTDLLSALTEAPLVVIMCIYIYVRRTREWHCASLKCKNPPESLWRRGDKSSTLNPVISPSCAPFVQCVCLCFCTSVCTFHSTALGVEGW